MEFSGDLETHLTIGLDGLAGLAALEQWGAQHGWKFVHIVLDRGDHTSQPMLTRQTKSSLAEELAAATEASRVLHAQGWRVNRLKIEAAPWNQDIPQNATDASAHAEERYFEHHIKLLLGAGAELAPLAALVVQHDARLSRNARRQRADGQQERFVTQRCWGVAQPEARRRLQALLAAIEPLGHPILEAEEEFVIYDSNLALDGGWFATKEA